MISLISHSSKRFFVAGYLNLNGKFQLLAVMLGFVDSVKACLLESGVPVVHQTDKVEFTDQATQSAGQADVHKRRSSARFYALK